MQDEKQAAALNEIANFQDEDYRSYYDNLNPETRRRIASSTKKTQHGLYATAPLTCLGPKDCPFLHKCPIPTKGAGGAISLGSKKDYPIGLSCIMEETFARTQMISYIKHLDISPDNPIEMGIANQLVIDDILKMRVTNCMSSGDRDGQGRDLLRIDYMYGEHGSGDKSDPNWSASDMAIATQARLHPLLDALHAIEKRRVAHLDRLMETRKGRLEARLKNGESSASALIQQQIKHLTDAVSRLSNEIELDEEPIMLTQND